MLGVGIVLTIFVDLGSCDTKSHDGGRLCRNHGVDLKCISRQVRRRGSHPVLSWRQIHGLASVRPREIARMEIPTIIISQQKLHKYKKAIQCLNTIDVFSVNSTPASKLKRHSREREPFILPYVRSY